MIFHKDLLPSIDPIFLSSGIKEELEVGHALPKGRKNTHFTKEQKDFLTEKFSSGVGAKKHKRKKVPQIALEMQMKFERKDWLTETQIQSFFVRLTAKQRSEDPTHLNNPNDDDDEENIPSFAEQDDARNLLQAIEQDDLEARIEEALETDTSIDDPHPFFVQGLDEGLCDLAKDLQECPSFDDSKLYGISKQMLLQAMSALNIPVKQRMTKSELGEMLVKFVQDKCGCVIFVEREN